MEVLTTTSAVSFLYLRKSQGPPKSSTEVHIREVL